MKARERLTQAAAWRDVAISDGGNGDGTKVRPRNGRDDFAIGRLVREGERFRDIPFGGHRAGRYQAWLLNAILPQDIVT